MCSTSQSPRAKKAFSRACAARTWPAPEVADSNKTRDLVFIGRGIPYSRMASGSLALAGGKFLQNLSPDFLQFAEARQVLLEIVVQHLRVLRVEFGSQNHVAQFHRVRGKRDDEVNLASDFEVGFGQEVQSPVTEISRVRVQLAPFGSPRHHAQW